MRVLKVTMRLQLMHALTLSDADCDEVFATAGEEIWRSLKRYGEPHHREAHVLTCTCGDCT